MFHLIPGTEPVLINRRYYDILFSSSEPSIKSCGWYSWQSKRQASDWKREGHFSHGEWVRKGVIEVGVIEL